MSNSDKIFWRVNIPNYWSELKLKFEEAQFEFQNHNLLSKNSIFVTDNPFTGIQSSKLKNTLFTVLLINPEINIESIGELLASFDFLICNNDSVYINQCFEKIKTKFNDFKTKNQNTIEVDKIEIESFEISDKLEKLKRKKSLILTELEFETKIQEQFKRAILLLSNEFDLNKILILLEKEFIEFNSIKKPKFILLINMNSNRYSIYSKQRGFFSNTDFVKNTPSYLSSNFVDSPSFVNTEWIQFLNDLNAEEMLGTKTTSSYPIHKYFKSNKESIKVILIVEQIFTTEEHAAFIKFFIHKLPYFAMAIENSIIYDDIQKNLTLWKRTFEEVPDPIAILNQKNNIILENNSFKNQNLNPHALENIITNKNDLDNIYLDSQIFEKNIYKIDSKNNTSYFLVYLKNITESKNLEYSLHINSKLQLLKSFLEPMTKELLLPLNKMNTEINKILERNNSLEISELKNAVARSLSIIELITSFSKGNWNSFEYSNVNILIQNCELFFKSIKRKVKIILNLKSKTNELYISAPLFQHVIFNLVKNASEVLDTNGIITISTEDAIIQNQRGCIISVDDNGPGLPASIKSQVLINPVTTKNFKSGTGLGLMFCSKVIKSFGGAMSYEDNKPQGAKFIIWIPYLNN